MEATINETQRSDHSDFDSSDTRDPNGLQRHRWSKELWKSVTPAD